AGNHQLPNTLARHTGRARKLPERPWRVTLTLGAFLSGRGSRSLRLRHEHERRLISSWLRGAAQRAASAVIILLTGAVSVHAATVTATWDANTEPDIAGYALSYGTASGVYTTTIDVGNVTTYQVTLAPGTYYFALQAYDTGGLTSAYSNEVAFTV